MVGSSSQNTDQYKLDLFMLWVLVHESGAEERERARCAGVRGVRPLGAALSVDAYTRPAAGDWVELLPGSLIVGSGDEEVVVSTEVDVITEMTDFREALATVLAALSMRDRIACVDSVLVFDLALADFLAHLTAAGLDGVSVADLTEIRAGLEQVKAPVLQYRAAQSQADQARHLDELVRRAAAHRAVVTRIATALGASPAAWEARCARDTLLVAAEKIDAKVKKVDTAVSAVWTGEEARDSTFKDRLTELETTHEEMAQLCDEAGAPLQNAVFDRLADGYEQAADRERRAGAWWRVIAAVAALVCAGTALFAAGGNTTWPRVFGHVAFTMILGGLATWAARLGDLHFKEQRALRTNHLRMPASLVWISQMCPEERGELQRKLANEFFGAVARAKDDGDTGSMSLFPVDKVIEVANNATMDRSAADDVRKE